MAGAARGVGDLGRFGVRGLLLAGLALFVLAAALFVPRGAAGERGLSAPRCVVLVDASGSVRRPCPQWLSWARSQLARLAQRAEADGAELAVIVFAADVALVHPPAAPAQLRARLLGRQGAPFDPLAGAGDDGQSRLAEAVRLAAGLLAEPARSPGSLVLVGDGGHEARDPLPLLAELARGGTRIERIAPPPAELADLALVGLEAPPTVESGAPLTVVAELFLQPGVRGADSAELALEIENGDTRRALVVPLELPAGPARWRVAVDCGPAGFGLTRVSAAARLAPGPDPQRGNDRAQVTVRADGALVVAAACRTEDAGALRAWLAPGGSVGLPGVQLVVLGVDELAARLDAVDLVLSFDLAPSALPRGPVEDFVRRGGGWLAVGGWRFLGDWVPGGTREGLAALLPLEPAPVDPRPREVLLLVDGSGSMAGEPFETVRAAALELVRAALPSDRVGLRFFTTRLEREHLLRERSASGGEAQAAEVARRLLGARVPGGQTLILRSLEQLARERGGAPQETLLLLLTDGRERDTWADPEAQAERMGARLASEGVALHVVAVGESPDLAFLDALAGRRPVARAEDLRELESIFRRAVGGARLREGEAIPVELGPLEPGSLGERAVGAGSAPPPAVRLLVRNRARADAETPWITERGEPLLGVRRVGLGRTALLSLRPDAEWAPSWVGRAGRGEPREVGPLLRWLGRGARSDRDRPKLALEEAGPVLSGLGADWPELVPLRLLGAQGEELASLTLGPVLSASGVRSVGCRAAPWSPSPGPPAESGVVSGPDGRERVLILARSLGRELRPWAPRLAEPAWEALERLAEDAGAPPDPGREATPSRAAPGVLAAALVLWALGALAARRQGNRPPGR